MVTMAGTAVQGQARWGIHLAAGGSSQALPRPVLGPPLLRQRMVDAMVLRGFAARTQQAYVGAVDLMARHYRVQAGSLSDEQIQAYLLHLLRQRGLSRSTVNQAACAARFMVCEVLGEVDPRPQISLGRRGQSLPELLSRSEVAALLAAARSTRVRAFLQTAYASGLRLSELCGLRICDIDSAPDRMCLRVVNGKGGQVSKYE